MIEFTKTQTAVAFYNKGRSCVEVAEFLFNQKKQHYDILLLQGVELLFKSFIIVNDHSITLEILRSRYSHNYIKAYRRCLKLDTNKLISGERLGEEINFLYKFYEKDYVALRYPGKTKFRHFSPSIFSCLKDDLIAPLFPIMVAHSSKAKMDEGCFGAIERDLGLKIDYDL